MEKDQVLIISFWNPTTRHPQQGVFIQDQAAAVCRLHDNIIFLQVNVLPSNSLCLRKEIKESSFYNNRLITVNFYSRLWKFLYVDPWRLTRILSRILKQKKDEIKPAIIHANVISPCGIVGYLMSERIGAKLIISEHWSKAGKFLKNPLYKKIAFRAYKKSSAVICVSEFLAHNIACATEPDNLIIVPNIIDNQIFTYKPKPSPEGGKLCFMCVASWRPPKRLDLIIEALSRYALETTCQIILRVVGTGIQAELLKKSTVPENLHIEWLGYLSKNEIAELLNTAQIFLHASEIETFSIVTAEALSTGTPVLASNTGALPELINDQNGMLTENTSECWARAVKEIVSKQFNYEAIALQQDKKYSPQEIGCKIISVYRKIYSNKSQGLN